MGNVIHYGNRYRCAEYGVPAYAEALGVRHPSEMQHVREVGGQLVFMPSRQQPTTAGPTDTASPKAKAEPVNRTVTVRATPPASLIHGLFTPVDRQAEIVFSWGKLCNWLGMTQIKFEETLIDVRSKARRMRWPDNRLTAIVLVPTLPEKSRYLAYTNTLIFLLSRIKRNVETAGLEFLSGPLTKVGIDTVRIAGSVRDTLKPGICIEVIDLGAMSDVSDWWPHGPNRLPNAGMLAAAALHPQWLLGADGVNIPFVVMAGYQLQIRGAPVWERVPSLSRPSPHKVAVTSHDVKRLPPDNGFKWALPLLLNRQ